MVFSFAANGSELTTLAFQSVGSSQQISATLIKPVGEGPFPAMVIMHDCSRLGLRSSGAPLRWAQELVSQGYVVMIPDSFMPRGFSDGVCTVPGNQAKVANGFVRAADAYGALIAIRKLSYVDGTHIGIMGGSHGGWTALAAMCASIHEKDPLAEAKRDGFTAAVALYPNCGARYGEWSTVRQNKDFGPVISHSGMYRPIAPVLILIGEKDDWTPAEDCRQMVEVGRKAGFPLDIVIYSGAYHSFDSDSPVRYNALRTNISSASGKGATTGGNSAAWSDAKKQVASFFARYLKSRRDDGRGHVGDN
ncbi:MAG: dienelactone hydrolase family protein [Deltaproteobacteria bacterium]|nr:dienelactone hydrolase family protein [Deltaproteobacteria bacterium]